MENIKSYFNFSRQSLVLLGVLFLVVIGIAATVLVAQQQQEIRKRAESVANPCVDMPDWQSKCSDNPACEPYSGIGPKEDKEACSIKNDQCLRNLQLNKETCESDSSCAWHQRGFCYTKEKQVDGGGDGDKDKNGDGKDGDGNGEPDPSTSCRVSWVLDPNPETSPANTKFRAYIKGESSKNSKGDPDWSFIKLKFDNGDLGAISEIKTGSLPPLTGNCSADQPCFKSNELNSGAINSTHNLVFSINNPEEPKNPNGKSTVCTPPKPFTTGSGGTITPTPPPGGGGGARLLLALNLEGFSGTYTPKRDKEPLIVLLRPQASPAGNLTAVESEATFSATHRHFRKLVDLPADLPDGIYELLLKGASTLRRTFGNITIGKGRETFVPFDPNKPLLSCDLNNDNLINMLDLNQLYTDIKKPKTEHKDSLADITRDGTIDIFDHNFCVQNFGKEGEKP
ncbi:hypothetical protein HYT17_02495 [Candidatus Microgenomates bacterium]|nr:hypothetical protein [Candidatus Microgenomates bacterium]